MPTDFSLSPEKIKLQLDAILASETFKNKNRIIRFLEYVVQESLKGRAHLIKGYTLGLEVFDKDETFNPQADAIVRVEAGRLRRLLEHYYMEEGRNDRVSISLPKGTYAPQITLSEPSPAAPEKDPVFSAAAAPPTGPAIAVLPFENLSGEDSQELFCDGITEEIINHLSLSPSLYVISRRTTSRYKGREIDIRALSAELEAHYILEGSIRLAGDHLRVSARLLNATNAAVIWSENYDRKLKPENLIQVQDEIATHVAATIGDTYGAVMRTSAIDMKRSSTEYMEAYESMLLLHDYLFELSPETHLKARDSLEKAIKIDPHYPDAWAGLAFLALDEYRFSFNVRGDDPLEQARKYAEKSIGLSSKYSIAWYAMTIINFHKGDIEKFEDNIRLGLSIAPNSPAILADSGVYLCLLGKLDQGLSLVRKAMELNPQHPGWCRFALCHDHFIRGEYTRAIEQVRHIETPDWFWPHALQAILYAALENKKGVKDSRANVLRLYPDFPENAEKECRKWFRREEDLMKYLDGLKEANLA
ncbi:hypothetical protein MNBD_ALPHA01-1326 [hydrothermal vent metagenome]|uniref:Uncharacterized protein n=1 Tax=hydrothermal vent metagenome TaxID=652676 RepID=A0A3B0SU86_9ZZZZ